MFLMIAIIAVLMFMANLKGEQIAWLTVCNKESPSVKHNRIC